jgi:hypothetical protein
MREGFSRHVKRGKSNKPRIPLVAAAVVAAAEGDDHDYFDPSAAGISASGTGGLTSAKSSYNSLLQRISNTLERVYSGGAGRTADAAAGGDSGAGRQASKSSSRGCCGLLRRYSSLIVALVMCQVGMILFNIGLTYGFTGEQAGCCMGGQQCSTAASHCAVHLAGNRCSSSNVWVHRYVGRLLHVQSAICSLQGTSALL